MEKKKKDQKVEQDPTKITVFSFAGNITHINRGDQYLLYCDAAICWHG